jgi:hypothetical protein
MSGLMPDQIPTVDDYQHLTALAWWLGTVYNGFTLPLRTEQTLPTWTSRGEARLPRSVPRRLPRVRHVCVAQPSPPPVARDDWPDLVRLLGAVAGPPLRYVAPVRFYTKGYGGALCRPAGDR